MRHAGTVRGFHVDIERADRAATLRAPSDESPNALNQPSGVRLLFNAVAALAESPMGQCPRCDSVLAESSGPCPACGAELAPFVVDGRYVVEEEIGHGGMGVVYRARDVSLERQVALKLVVPWGVDLADLERRLRNEAAALASVRSPHVVQVHSFGAHGNSWFFAMELVRGQGLFELMEEQRVLPIPRALTIARHIAAGLGALHAAGIIHRDVKPSNVLIEDRTGRAVLIDLGIARRIAPTAGTTTRALGTPAYMAPEQVTHTTGARITARSDIYGLACTLFELFTGQLPFERTDDPIVLAYRHVHEIPPAPSSIRAELAPLDAIFARALAKDPKLRPNTAEDFVSELETAYWRSVSESARPPASSVRPSSGPRSRPLRILVIGNDDEHRELVRSAAQIAFTGRSLRLGVASFEQAPVSMESIPPDLVLHARGLGNTDEAPQGPAGSFLFVVTDDGAIELGGLVTALRLQASSWGLLEADRRSSRSGRPTSG